MKTIKQLADEVGIDKQRVYRFIKKNHINEAHQKAGVMYYDDAVKKLIKQHFTKDDHINEAHQTTSLDALIDTLRNELNIKNEQIRELNERLAESNAALVSAQQSLQTAQMLHGGTIQKQLTDEVMESSIEIEESEKFKKGFFKRFFGRR